MVLAILARYWRQIVVVAVALGAVWWTYHWISTRAYDRGHADGERPYLEALQASATAYAEAAAHQQVVVDTLTSDLAAERSRKAVTVTRYEEIVKHDPESRDWSVLPVPGAVRGVLNDGADRPPVPTNPGRTDHTLRPGRP